MILDVELVGFADLVKLFAVSKTRVEQLVRDPKFPETHYVGDKRTRVWELSLVEEWARAKGRTLHDRDQHDDDPR
jgi:hypothetical protein